MRHHNVTNSHFGGNRLLRVWLVWGMLTCSAAVLVGCNEDPRVGKVNGQVTLDGEPVANANVTFMPLEGGRPAFGSTDDDGRYELTTFEPGDGAVVGKHVVTILAVEEKVSAKMQEMSEEYGSIVGDVTSSPKRKWLIPELFSDAETSGLEFEVMQGSNQADFPLTTP